MEPFAELTPVPNALDQASQGNSTPFSTPRISDPADEVFAAQVIIHHDWPASAKIYSDFLFKKQLLLRKEFLAPHTNGMSQTWRLLAGAVGCNPMLTNPPYVLNPRIESAPPILLVNSLWAGHAN
jgi:hypothetical protein